MPPPWWPRHGGKESVWSRGRYWLQTLGCPKNQVDSDKLAGRLATQGYRRAADPSEADLVVVNTCAFIESARQESIDTVLELADLRSLGGPPGRHRLHGRALRRGADRGPARSGPGGRVRDRLRRAASQSPPTPGRCPGRTDRRNARPPPHQGVRSARVGPSGVGGPVGLRQGGRRVRPHLRLLCHPVLPGQAAVAGHVDEIMAEVALLLAGGSTPAGDAAPPVREIVLVAQDLASYGRDRSRPGERVKAGRSPIAALTRAVSAAGRPHPAALPVPVRV